jgi:TRAP-type C4-dicarboxylate transport system substrate-binding protein
VADPLIFVTNRDVWNSWTDEDRKIVRQAAIEAGDQEIAIARKGLTGTDTSMIKEVEALGVKVTQPTAAEIAEFKKVLKPVYDKWAKQIGADMVKKAEAAVASTRKA